MSNKETTIYTNWRNAESYMQKKGFTTCIPQWVDFYEGRQWGNIAKGTETLPRPVVNITEMIVDNKASNILGSPVTLNFIPDNSDAKTNNLSKFAKYQLKELGIDALDREACLDGLVKGTYIYHLYFDEEAIGKKSKYKGSVRGETLDPLNVRVSNPCEKDCQKQKWIIVRSREEKKRIIDSAEDLKLTKEEIELIKEDTLDNYYADEVEQEGSALCTVYTKYFRIDGEVYYQKATKSVVLGEAKALSPLVNKQLLKKRKEEEEKKKLNENEPIDIEDAQISNTPDPTLDKPDNPRKNQYKFNRYPIEIGSLKPRNKCIYGRSEVEGILPNQKIINSSLALTAYSIQTLGMPATVVKPGFLNGQKITTKAGAVYTDYSNVSNGWGIYRLEGQQVNNGIVDFGNTVLELTRVASNSTEVLTGEIIGKDLSGTAIAQLQAQSKKPIDAMQKRFWTSKERIGKILEQFYKLYYREVEFSVQLSQAERMEIARIQGVNEVPEYIGERFNGQEHLEEDFNIVVEAGQGTQYSEIMAIDTLNKMFGNRALIDLTPDLQEQYISLCPDSVMPFKSEYKEVVKEQQMRENAMLKQQVQELQGLLGQAKETLENVGIQFNALKDEFKNKTNVYNEQLLQMQNFMRGQKSSYSENNDSQSRTE